MIYIKIILRILLISCFFDKASAHDQIDFEPLQNIEKELPDSFIISNEGLFSKGWEFNRIFKSFEYIISNTLWINIPIEALGDFSFDLI